MIVYETPAAYLSLRCLILACVIWLAGGQESVWDSQGAYNVRPPIDQLTASESIAQRGAIPAANQLQQPKSSPKNADFVCPTQFGHYRDPGNCAAYYICSFGLSLRKNCSSGLYFSEKLQICDWPSSVLCERDYASLAETSVFNLVDESSTTVAPLVHHRKPVTPNVLPVAIPLAPNGNTAGPSVSLLRAPSQPNLEDTLPGYSEDAHVSTSRSSTHAISGSGQSRGAHLLNDTSTTLLTPQESSDAVSHIRAEESSKFASAKYVVDGFEVPSNNRGKPRELNLYSEEDKQQQQPPFPVATEKRPSSGLRVTRKNSTFLEISNLSVDRNKNSFQKRNDYEPYWSSLSYSNQPRSANPFLIETKPEQPRSYYRHRPQGELLISNGNPYQVGKPTSDSYYVYDSAPETRPVSPYRSRYQHRYQEAGRVEPPARDLPSSLPASYHQPRLSSPPKDAPISLSNLRPPPQLSEPVKSETLQPVSYGTSKASETASPIRRKVPEVYIEVISSDNLTSPYTILTDGRADQSLYMVDSRPMKRLNYEINERLLAPFKQREQGSQVNWLDKSLVAERPASVSLVSGVNRYSNQLNEQVSPYRNTSPGQYRKKVIRKKKISRLSGLAASSSSTNLYGHSSTHLLTGTLVTKPAISMTRPSSPRMQSSLKMPSTSLPTFHTENVAGSNIELSGWRPVTAPIPRTTTPSPLLTYPTSLSDNIHKLTLQEFLPMTSPTPRIETFLSEAPAVSEVAPKTVNFDFKDALKANYESLSNHKLMISPMKGEVPKATSKAPYRVKYTPTGKPKKANAQYNRYVVIPQSNPSPINVMFEYQNTTAKERNRIEVADTSKGNQDFPQSKFIHDIARIVPTESPVVTPVAATTPRNSAPFLDSLENFIKKTIDSKSSPLIAQSNFTQARSFPPLPSVSLPVANYLDGHVDTGEDGARAALPRRFKPMNGYQSTRKYRPLISLNQTTPSAPGGPAFSSQRLTLPPTTASPVDTGAVSFHYSEKGSINLNDPNTIFVYHSPRSNELSESKAKLPFFTTTSVDARFNSLNGQPMVTQSPILPTLPMTTLRLIKEMDSLGIQSNFIHTTPVTSTTKKPTVYSTTTTTTTSTTTTPAPVTTSTDSYGYFEGDYNNNDYDYDYRLMGNKSSVLAGPSSTTAQSSPTTTTTTTTPAPVTPLPAYRRPNVTSKPLIYLSNRPRPTNRRLVIKDSSANQPVTLASRPKAMYSQPKALVAASKCEKRKCRLPDCRCGGSDVPGDLPNKQIPQLIMLTFDDGVNDLNWELYEELLNSGRKNPNGCPVKATFYVSHEWTDYGQIQTLYSRGHEIASHSISHRFGEKFSKEEWVKEINGQREILNLYGGVKFEDIRGMRAPFLQTGGNNMFQMLYETNFTYDSSLPVQENSPPFWPYTLDYSLSHSCNIPPCPTRSYPGLWEVGMVMWSDLRGGRCSMGDACTNPADESGVYEMLLKNFNRHYKSNRAPFSLYYHSAWFNTQHHRRGFIKFLDEILQNNDVYMVTTWQALQWVREPTLLSKLSSFEPFQCQKKGKPIQECNRPKVCNVNSKQGSRTLRTCQECPPTGSYPWIGSTGFSKAKYG